MARTFVMDRQAGGTMEDLAHIDDDGEVTYETRQHNEQDILSQNDSIRNDRGGLITKRDGGLHHVARIPQVLWERWTKAYPELIHGDKKTRDARLASLINDRDFNRVRTSEKSRL